MPWCEPCERFYNPNSVRPDGTCPRCATSLGEPVERGVKAVPWHFWLLLVAVVLYLGWRLLQGLVWVSSRF